MIIANEREELSLLGNKNTDLDRLIDYAHDIHDNFITWNIDETFKQPISFEHNEAGKESFIRFAHRAQYGTPKGYTRSDITQYAFGQACDIWGIPAKYIQRLTDDGMSDLVYDNIKRRSAFAATQGRYNGIRCLQNKGVVEAFVSDKYDNTFPACNVLETIKDCINTEVYAPNQAYISNSKMHVRFIDIDNPIDIPGAGKMTFGFTVDSSDIGKSALRITFFIYKFSCKNGIVRVAKGGTIYRQVHMGQAFTQANIEEFKSAFNYIDALRENSIDLIMQSTNRMMSEREMFNILDACRKYDISSSEKEKEKIINLADTKYGRTKWGLINGITEVAQNHTLDNRLAYEAWAGKLLERKIS